MSARRLLVVGGSGYLGKHVVRAGLTRGFNVASLSRSGAPSFGTDGLEGAEWISGSAESEADVARALAGADAVVSVLGTPFGTPESIRRINGDANVAIAAAAASAGVKRYAYVSAATFRLMERMFPDSWGAYFEGKRRAEAAVEEHFGAAGAVLKPGIIYTESIAEFRQQAGSGLQEAKMPNIVGVPLSLLLGLPPVQMAKAPLGAFGDFLAPPVCVADVAAQAIAHVDP
jgi:uncharacterized protein YbjT (DUF2867 family)